MKKICLCFVYFIAMLLLVACAGERQGLVCEEIEYRLNTQTYSPDQRAYIEEELRVCREDEAQKRGADAATRQSIYDRFASSDTTSRKNEDGTTSTTDSTSVISVSKALQDTSSQQTQSIYDRYKSDAPAETPAASSDTPAEVPADAENTASDISEFQ